MNTLVEIIHSLQAFIGHPAEWFAGLWLIILLVAGFLSMLGQGGGTLYAPLQVLFGIHFHEAATTSLFLIMVTSVSATLIFQKAHRIDWVLAIALESVTTTGSLIGGITAELFPVRILIWILAGIMTFAALFMLQEFGKHPNAAAHRKRWFHWHRHFNGHHYAVNMLLALPVSFIAGFLSGLTGVGGGVLKVPFMVLLLGVPMEIAVGSSSMMVGITAAGGFAGHMIARHWNWRVSVLLAVAVFAGGQIGARISLKLKNSIMKKIFGVTLLVIASILIARNLGYPI